MNPNSIAEISATLLVAAALSTPWLSEAKKMHVVIRVVTILLVGIWLAFIAWSSVGGPTETELTAGMLAVAIVTFLAIFIGVIKSSTVASGKFTTTSAVQRGTRNTWTWNVVAD